MGLGTPTLSMMFQGNILYRTLTSAHLWSLCFLSLTTARDKFGDNLKIPCTKTQQMITQAGKVLVKP